MTLRISPSLASAPMDRLGEVIRELEHAGADMIHFDIEDGSFVPVMTLGLKMIADLRPLTHLPFDVHLMMVNPEWILPEIIQSGADRISFHYEATQYPRRVLRQIHDLGAAAGLAFNPASPLPDLAYLQPYLSFVLLLSTEPEGPDCPFLPDVLQKLKSGKQQDNQELEWVVDGGINTRNLPAVAEAGADTVVIGRAVFLGNRIEQNLLALRSLSQV